MKKANWYELLDSDDYPHLIAANHLCGELADALIAIVGQPWLHLPGLGENSEPGAWCDTCGANMLTGEGHEADSDCAWLISARALGIAD